MRCLCIGICQLGAVVEILKRSKVFTSKYADILFYPVFNISVEEMNRLLNDVVPTSDLIISQPVSNNYKGTDIFSSKKLRETCLKYGKPHLIMSNCYFTGYDPTPFQTTNLTGEIITQDGISYYPSLCVNSLLEGSVVNSCKKWCQLDAYTKKELDNNLALTLTELKTREQKVFDNPFSVDITISDYVEMHFKEKFLFHTYNHPTNILLMELFRRLMSTINLPCDTVHIDKELLGDNTIPPPPSVYYGYGCKFKYPKFVINRNEYPTNEAMLIFIDTIMKIDKTYHDRWKSGISWGRSKLQ